MISDQLSDSARRVLAAYLANPKLFEDLASRSPCRTILYALTLVEDPKTQGLVGTALTALGCPDMLPDAVQAAQQLDARKEPYLCLCAAIEDPGSEEEEFFVLFLGRNGRLLDAPINAPGGEA